MMALLEETKIELDDSVDTGNGEHTFYDRTMRDHKPGGYGVLSVQEVFEYSSNIGIAKLVTEHFSDQPEKFVEFLEELGLAKPIGFQMVGEGWPYIKHPTDSSWSGTTLPWMSHGYELKMTPLQTLTLYNAIANEGKMIKPIIVKSVVNANKKIETYETEILRHRICSRNTLKKLQAMLEGVVEKGTAKNIRNDRFTIAGKTGTAKRVKNGKYTSQYYTSFAGYFPADEPKYSCIVVIDNPKGFQIYGSDVAAPVFKEIADKIFALEIEMHQEIADQSDEYAGIFPVIRSGHQLELATICNELGVTNLSNDKNAAWVTTDVSGDSVFWKKNEITPGLTPDVRGMTLRDAIFILENAGLKVSVNGKGRVKQQSIGPGSRFYRGNKILLDLG
jgi:cell division protein FtsI (penicillin-binding protein 3)